jgi:hypothetical protein
MVARRAARKILITENIALEIARLVLKEEDGEAELVRQSPFSISEEGDAWVVTGRQREATDEDASRPSRQGPFEMKISKFSGQIYDCHYIMYLARRFTPPS